MAQLCTQPHSPTQRAGVDKEEPLRTGKDLYRATVPFAEESRLRSWWHTGSTLTLLVASLAAAALMPWLAARIVAAVLGALLMVRSFILYHDFMHGSILKKSRLGKIIMHAYGLFSLTPPRSWRYSHNYHHGNVGKIAESGIGSFPLMTAQAWREASTAERFRYRFVHHPLIVLFSYPVIFLVSLCLKPLFLSPRKHWDSAVSVAAHGGAIVALWVLLGFDAAFFAIILPTTIACALGSYLFYAQHNFPGMRVLPTDQWNYFDAALQSSSYMKLGPVMRFFTGNIGFHHIHHLNSKIPFYRLPEAMAAIPELQSPVTTTLHPRDIVGCFRMTLWDPERDSMVSYREAMLSAPS
jgi:omega-6 fatty acid desaturase (delta-12 desaturase)